jgi:hypothetical protein
MSLSYDAAFTYQFAIITEEKEVIKMTNMIFPHYFDVFP